MKKKTHDLEPLFSSIIEKYPSLSSLSDDIMQLNSLGAGIRYPDDFYNPTNEEAGEMVVASEKIIDSLKNEIVEPSLFT